MDAFQQNVAHQGGEKIFILNSSSRTKKGKMKASATTQSPITSAYLKHKSYTAPCVPMQPHQCGAHHHPIRDFRVRGPFKIKEYLFLCPVANFYYPDGILPTHPLQRLTSHGEVIDMLRVHVPSTCHLQWQLCCMVCHFCNSHKIH